MPSPLVVAHDGTDRPTGAALLAQAVAGFLGAPLIVASACSAWPASPLHGAAFDRLTPEDAGAALARARAALGTFPGTEYRAVSGVTAASALTSLARSESAALLAVGTSHHAVVAGVAPGSVSEQVLHEAPCPVAVVPPETGRPAIARLAVACDGSSAAAEALAFARTLAEALGSPVRSIDLVVVEDDEPHRILDVRDPGLFVKGPSAASEWVAREARVPAGSAEVRIVRRPGDPATVLAGMSYEYDVLLMGSRNHGPLRRVLLGSVSTRLVREARCPIVVCPRRPQREPDRGDGPRRLQVRIQDELHRPYGRARLGR